MKFWNHDVSFKKTTAKKSIFDKTKCRIHFFLMLTEIEFKYWSTKFEMTILIWTIRRITYMIKNFKHVTIIYTDHEINSSIVVETKLNITNIDKLNMKLIRAFIYFSQFRIEMRHRFDKFNIISNALNRLSMKSFIKKKITST